MLLQYIAVLSNLVSEFDCSYQDVKLVCGRRVLVLTALNLVLYWDYVIVFSAIYGSGASLQLDGLGDG